MASNLLKCVGETRERLTEDGLRLLRAMRFLITKSFEPDVELEEALQDELWWIHATESVSEERIREEFHKMFKHNTVETLRFLMKDCSPEASEFLFGASTTFSTVDNSDIGVKIAIVCPAKMRSPLLTFNSIPDSSYSFLLDMLLQNQYERIH